ncbi:hypothetical protein [Bordetella pseudohinzii]|uniref:Uncharacterized protein n=1 Tax=Bordetella pseudohinzii TaxID=1331258 RepID=A0A0J6CCK0_9BORD|nr:hypothetical protein [Bordetella pseudohinzii]ANY15383.1 hypothetical protein BBN53_05450 [Bordetella pseudohinzii]KMM27307.1 hypothetical protein L540_09930 [Bordetella pseudohinzii]KXA79393.1 hypothetical protein AW877_09125 [Bordetella pseudohinzii]KXA82510.1 hypothetical protein AW878_00520 [Bordetella pseudohinzii]CUI86598.1 Uncharacterised protein [Bordetella pseudohinzii]
MSYDTENLKYAIAKLAEKVPEHSEAMQLLKQLKRHLLHDDAPAAAPQTRADSDTALLDWLRDNHAGLRCQQADAGEAAGWAVQFPPEEGHVRRVFRDPREAIRAAMVQPG